MFGSEQNENPRSGRDASISKLLPRQLTKMIIIISVYIGRYVGKILYSKLGEIFRNNRVKI